MEDEAEVATDSGSCHDHPTAASTEGSKVGSDDATGARSRSSSAAATTSKLDTWGLEKEVLFLCVVLVVAVPVVVWRSRSMSQPPELVVWRLSLLLCGCSIVWSRLLDAAMSVQTTALFFSSGFVLALYADARMGALIAQLNSYFAAGMLGYALAERRLRDGTEVSAAAGPRNPPPDKEVADRVLFYQRLSGIYFSVVTLGFAAPAAWLVWHRADFPIEELILYVSVPLPGVLMLWIMFVGAALLQGALFGEGGHCLLVMYLGFSGLLFTMVSVLVSQIGAMIFIWLAMLGFPGFLGYSLSVYASFKLRLKLGQLPMKHDENKEESPRKPLLQKLGHGSKDSPCLPMPSSATPSSPRDKGELLFDSNMRSKKGSPS